MSSSDMGYENQQGYGSSSSNGRAPWKIYTTSNVDPASWKAGTGGETASSSSMNAVSFGFVATAILVALFLIMAILEHLFRPTATQNTTLSSSSNRQRANNIDSTSKLSVHHQTETTSYGGGVSVVMPGDKYPSCIAKLAPLECPRQQALRCPSNYNINHHAFAFS